MSMGMTIGDGVNLAGCTILHMLEQRHRFELFSFNGHVLAVHMAEDGEVEVDNELALFLHRVALSKRGCENVFTMMESADCPTVYNVWRHS